MKQVKNLLYVLAVAVILVLLTLAGTAVVQFGMLAVAEKIGIVIAEDMLYHVSGSSGVAIAGIICAVYVKKKRYVEYVGEVQPLNVKRVTIYTGLVLCVCQVLSYAVTTMLFANVFPMEQVQVQTSITWVDVVFAMIMAPIFEELLFRMSFYSLLCRRFRRESSIVICAVTFAVIHGYQLQGFLACLVAGLTFTLLFDKTRNIWYCIIAHAFCNLFVSVGNVLENAEVTLWGIALQYEINGYVINHPLIIVGAVVYCGLFWWMSRKQKCTMQEQAAAKPVAQE